MPPTSTTSNKDAIKVSDIDDLLREINEVNAIGVTTGSISSQFQSEAQRRRQMEEDAQRRTSAAVQFSTYVPPPPELLENAVEPVKVPQGIRLVPMGGGGGAAAAAAASPQPIKKGAAMTVDAAAIAEAARNARAGSMESAVADGYDDHFNHQNGGGLNYDDDHYNNHNSNLPHVVNFLPVMHARLMTNIAGISPKGRWGHSITAVGDALYLFGGTTADGNATNDLFQFLPKHNSFEPLHIRGNATPTPTNSGADGGGGGIASSSSTAAAPLSRIDPPSARSHHSAVAYQGRYLVIFGGSAERGTVLLNDVHVYDTKEETWRHVVTKEKDAKHEPTGRFGHSAVVIGSNAYFFGGKCIKKSTDANSAHHSSASSGLSNDVYVFCLNTFAWKKRIHVGSGSAADEGKVVPSKRFHHAACVIGGSGVMYVHGGEASAGQLLGDTWALDVHQRQWRVVHSTADSVPRSRHALFGCGEALLAVAGVSAAAPQHQQVPLAVLAVMETDPTTGVPSPIAREQMGGWIPVSLGTANANTIPSTAKSFGATSHNGFVYAFGGVVGGAQPNISMTRCLAMDGVPIATEPFAALQAQMRNLREDKSFVDLYIEGIADGSALNQHHHQQRRPSFTGIAGEHIGSASNNNDATAHRIGLHRLILQHRAPKFYADILTCRSEQVYVTAAGAQSAATGAGSAAIDSTAAPTASTSTVPCYVVAGNSRVKGLQVAFTPTALELWLDYLYIATAPLSAEDVAEGDFALLVAAATVYDVPVLKAYLSCLAAAAPCAAATAASLPPASVVSFASGGSPSPATPPPSAKAVAECLAALRKDLPDTLANLLSSSTGATATLVFVDRDTHMETTYAAHPLLLCISSDYFKAILRPIIAEGKASHQCHGGAGGHGVVTAKRMENVSSKRSIVVGKVPIPRLGTKHVMRYLYTRELSVPPEDALLTMMAASTLGLEDLQAHCESIVAREEVNYDTACTYIALANTHKAPLLAELSMLTAALGFFEPGLYMEDSIPFVNLPKGTQATIRSIAAQLQGKWSAPPDPSPQLAMQQDAHVYQARIMSSAQGAGYGRTNSNTNSRSSASPGRF